jgi:hypothetical protein
MSTAIFLCGGVGGWMLKRERRLRRCHARNASPTVAGRLRERRLLLPLLFLAAAAGLCRLSVDSIGYGLPQTLVALLRPLNDHLNALYR